VGLTELEEAIRNDLRDNIEDPIGRNSDWIDLDSLENISSIGKTPRIRIEQAPGTSFYRSCNSGTPDKFLRYQIHIIVKDTDRGVLNGENINSSRKLMSELVQNITDRLEAVSVSISPTYIAMLQEIPTGGSFRIDNITNVRTLEYEVQKI